MFRFSRRWRTEPREQFFNVSRHIWIFTISENNSVLTFPLETSLKRNGFRTIKVKALYALKWDCRRVDDFLLYDSLSRSYTKFKASTTSLSLRAEFMLRACTRLNSKTSLRTLIENPERFEIINRSSRVRSSVNLSASLTRNPTRFHLWLTSADEK